VNGLAGDRFAVRNSGAIAVVEGTGLHACEYMTNGVVVILGKTSPNIGAGMTGGTLFTNGDRNEHVNSDYVTAARLSDVDERMLKLLLEDYLSETGSNTASAILANWHERKSGFVKWEAL
jgi:glutamate synthase domain-containing protein 3